MRLCNIDPILCTDLYNIPDIPVKLPRSIAWAKVFMELTNFVLNDVPVTVDTFLENYLYNDTNDLIVPTASMEAGLADNYISKFPDLNVCHITALGNERGVTGNTEIIGTVFSKLKQKIIYTVADNPSSVLLKINNIVNKGVIKLINGGISETLRYN